MQQPRVGIGVLIFNNNQILLGQRLMKHGVSTWAPPGGHLEFGETLEACAIREVKEETDLDIEAPVFATLTNDIFLADNKHYISIFMKASYPPHQVINNLEPDKVSEWRWFDVNNLPDNLFLPLQNLLKADYQLSLCD